MIHRPDDTNPNSIPNGSIVSRMARPGRISHSTTSGRAPARTAGVMEATVTNMITAVVNVTVSRKFGHFPASRMNTEPINGTAMASCERVSGVTRLLRPTYPPINNVAAARAVPTVKSVSMPKYTFAPTSTHMGTSIANGASPMEAAPAGRSRK